MGAYEIPMIGVQYIITAQVTARQGSLQEMLSVFGNVVIYNSAPLPPRYFNMSVDGDFAHFMFLPPRSQSENGTPASYDYMVITCSSYYNNWTADEGQTVSKTIDKTFDLVNYDEIVDIKWSLTDRLRGLFQHGSFIKCKLLAAAVQDITKYSQSVESSFVIAPVLPELALHLQETQISTIFAIEFETNRSTQAFDSLHVSHDEVDLCRFNLSDLSIRDRFTCKFERHVSGIEYMIQVKAWSTGPKTRKKTVMHLVSLVAPPRPPKSMAIDLTDGGVFISLDLGNLSTNIFDTVYLNGSDDSTVIVQLSTQNATHPVKWRSLSPDTVNTFHCWTGVDINGKHYLSPYISADWSKSYNDDNNGPILLEIIVLGMILLLTVTVLIAGCFRIRKWKGLSQVHSKCDSKPRISISAQSSDQELEEWMVKMQTIKRSREMKNITIFPPKLNTLEEKSTYYYTFIDESAFTAG